MIGIKGHSYQGHHMGVVEVLHLQDFTHHTVDFVHCEETYSVKLMNVALPPKTFTFQGLDSNDMCYNQCVRLKKMCSIHHSKFTYHVGIIAKHNVLDRLLKLLPSPMVFRI